MRNIDAYLGAAAYVLLSALMTAQALEPVELRAPAAVAGSALCDGGVELVMGCESVHL